MMPVRGASAHAEQKQASLYDGEDAASLALRLKVPRIEIYERVTSTLDIAHTLAGEGAPAGTVVIAEEQVAGRGRAGRSWRSEPGAGLWLTVLERPADTAAIEVLSLRIGITLAPLLVAYAGEQVLLKWPNDLYVGERKLAGTLIEARWRGERADWVAVGFGINVKAPAGIPAAGLAKGVSRLELLGTVVEGIRAACRTTGPLSAQELERFAERDMAQGRRCVEPVMGTVQGIDARGALLVDREGGTATVREGSLVLEAE